MLLNTYLMITATTIMKASGRIIYRSVSSQSFHDLIPQPKKRMGSASARYLLVGHFLFGSIYLAL
jgi:hypothetical protein